MIARLEIHKDQPTRIKAARILKQEDIKFIAQLIGEGSRRQEYEELIRAERVEECVRLLGMRRGVLERGNLGYLVPPKSPESIATGILEVIAHSAKALHKVTKAKQKVFNEFSLENMAKQYVSYLDLV